MYIFKIGLCVCAHIYRYAYKCCKKCHSNFLLIITCEYKYKKRIEGNDRNMPLQCKDMSLNLHSSEKNRFFLFSAVSGLDN